MRSKQKLDITKIINEKNITHVSLSSKYIKQGSAFFVTKIIPEYIKEAIEKGAKYIISQEEIGDLHSSVENIIVENIDQAILESVKHLYSEKPKYIIGVTGTSGKTSVVDYVRQLCSFAGKASASIGTMGIICSDKDLEDRVNKEFGHDMTTPNLILTHQIMNFLARNSVTHIVFEVSSHALDQDRIAGIELDVAVFTNLSQDHLDYHKTIAHYKRSKLKIFTHYLKQDGIAVTSDRLYHDSVVKTHLLKANCMKENKNLTIVGTAKSSDIQILKVDSSLENQMLHFKHFDRDYEINLAMVGSFQSINVLMALASTISIGINFEEILKHIEKLRPVKGRLDRITNQNHSYHIFTDYAHKPEALEFCLKELKKLCKSRLVLVFGCGGNRDKVKRKIMGESAAKFADITIITDDNPRLEDPESIRKDVLEGAKGGIEIANRDEAIKHAVKMLQKDDVLLIAGKGHEHYMDIGGAKVYFNDEEEVRKYI